MSPKITEPISTSFYNLVSRIFGLVRDSSIGRKVASLSPSRRFELSVVIGLALLTIIFGGSRAEGQTNILSSTLGSYVEETALSIAKLRKPNTQLAEINSFVGSESRTVQTGRGGTEKPEATVDITTVQDNSVVAFSPSREDYIDTMGAQRNGISEYAVQEGDALSFIASDYGVSINSILWANNLKNADSISPGQILRIPPVSGVIHKVKKGDTVGSIAKRYGVQGGDIVAFNELPQDGQLRIDDEIMVPGGVIQGYSGAGNQTGTYTQSGSVRTAKKFAYLPDFAGFFLSPTVGYNWGILHGRNGVDVANSCGTPISAAADGTVETAKDSGWNGGYGKFIKIIHQNGTETLYGHISKLLITADQVVTKGQLIALMGSTGRSTGCHLHFEVHGARNPLAKY